MAWKIQKAAELKQKVEEQQKLPQKVKKQILLQEVEK